MTASPTVLAVPHPTTLTVTGHGCVPASASQPAVTITANSTPPPAPVHATPGAGGDWTAHVTIPYAVAVHQVELTATCTGAATFAYPVVDLNYQPFLFGDGYFDHTTTLTTATTVPGGTLHVRSVDWQPHQSAEVAVDPSGTPLTEVTADAHGRIDATVSVPAHTALGKHLLWLHGGHSSVTETEEIDIVDVGSAAFTLTATDSSDALTLARTGPAAAPQLTVGVLLLFGGGVLALAGSRRR